MASRQRVAIVSTYNELCGIAGYTRALERQLRTSLDVEVFDLDQYLLRSRYHRVQKLGDRHIEEIAAKLRNFDSINIQLEHSTLGRTPVQILHRFNVLTNAAPCLSVTFHTITSTDPTLWATAWGLLRRGHLAGAVQAVGESLRCGLLSLGIYGKLRQLQAIKPVRVIVHTKRDMRLLRDVHRLREVFHHPLSYVDPVRAREIRKSASRGDFPILRTIPADAKLIGSFGFLSDYKGFETAVQALRYLPEDHHLLICGGIHPQTIRRGQPVDPYISRLLRAGRIGQTLLDHLREGKGSLSIAADTAGALLSRHPQDLHGRMHFMGVLTDEEFLLAMSVCDAVVLPYLEIGQSSSGPISMALDMGCRVLASRTSAFMEFSRYHPGQAEFFDIGNYAELAERLRAESPIDCSKRKLVFNTHTNVELYVHANTPPGAIKNRVGRLNAQTTKVAA
jgi:glycosyltransferase involved in cell wall biosynthesis